MPLSTEQKAWQLHENGVQYGDIASNANIDECSMDEAIEALWEKKFGKKETA